MTIDLFLRIAIACGLITLGVLEFRTGKVQRLVLLLLLLLGLANAFSVGQVVLALQAAGIVLLGAGAVAFMVHALGVSMKPEEVIFLAILGLFFGSGTGVLIITILGLLSLVVYVGLMWLVRHQKPAYLPFVSSVGFMALLGVFL
ncbi:MAG: hypothetical protein HY341_00290 [Candidatus Kerfeldbacteria bacterium]|nr:hypothetical protein [Candidatus Kerfeldbacteria bacterium]